MYNVLGKCQWIIYNKSVTVFYIVILITERGKLFLESQCTLKESALFLLPRAAFSHNIYMTTHSVVSFDHGTINDNVSMYGLGPNLITYQYHSSSVQPRDIILMKAFTCRNIMI